MSAQENIPGQSEAAPEESLERKNAREVADRINDVSDAQMSALEKLPNLADKDNAARALRWGMTAVMTLMLTAESVKPAQAGQESFSQGKARAQNVVYDLERGVRDELYRRELKDIESMQDAEAAYEKLVHKLDVLTNDLDLLNRRFRTLAREKVSALIKVQKVQNGTDYVQAVEAYTDAVIDFQFLELSFRQRPVDIEAPDYHARVAQFQDVKKRVEALSVQLQGMDESTLGFDPAYPPYEVTRYLDVYNEIQQVIPEMRVLDAARVRAEDLLEKRTKELEKMGKKVKSSSLKRSIFGSFLGIGADIAKKKFDPYNR